jgi:hypothetical protein
MCNFSADIVQLGDEGKQIAMLFASERNIRQRVKA